MPTGQIAWHHRRFRGGQPSKYAKRPSAETEDAAESLPFRRGPQMNSQKT